VDDEPGAADNLQRILDGRGRVVVANDQGQVTGRLAGERFDAIIVDVGAPGIDGPRLLGAARDLDPQMVRIIVSDGSNTKNVLAAIKLAHQALVKPFDPSEMKAVLKRSVTIHDLLADSRLADLVAGIETLPSLPAQYVRLMEEINSRSSSLERVGQIIGEDIGMTATVLKLVNSSFFSLRRQVTSLVQAVALLGLDVISALTITHHLFATFDQRRLPGFSFDGLWRHSLVTGGFARKVAQAAHQDKSAADTAFVAGLLHDTGKLVLGSTVTDHYRKVLQIVGQENRLIWEVEREVLGTTHAEVGAYLIGLWGLDEAVVEALAYHHRPSECGRQDFSPLAAVHVANVLEHELCVIHDDYARPELDATFLTRTSLHDKVERWRNLYRQVAAGHDVV
jgi:HD-like signal output (HDOD) protein